MEALPGAGTGNALVKALVPITVGIVVYFGAARLFRVPEARLLVKRFRR